jgi:predicted RNA-binding Zn-ribbon protein involved in translation (DUF1610 family)
MNNTDENDKDVNRSVTLEREESRELAEELLKIEKVDEKTAYKIADLLPADRDKLRSAHAKEQYSLSGNELDEILNVVAKYVRLAKKRDERDLDRVNTQVREERRQEATRKWRLQPIEKFIEAKKKDGRLDDQLNGMERIIRRFEDFLLGGIDADTELQILGVRDAIDKDIENFRDEDLLKDSDLRNSTIIHKLGYLNQFYNELDAQYAVAGNPVTEPLADFRNNHDTGADRPHIPFDRMQVFLNWLTHPFSRCFWLAGFKHGTRVSEVINYDLRCLHIDHPIFWKIIDEHDVTLDPRIRDKPDTILVYEEFNEGDEIPNEDTPGPETEGEIRNKAAGNKRKEEGGSVLPLDSEFKTALIEYLLVRPLTYGRTIHPLFAIGGSRNAARRPDYNTITHRLWSLDSYEDSIQRFSEQEAMEECPTCGETLIEENLANAEETGRRFRCRHCTNQFWRSIHWDTSLDTEQKVTFHEARHYFTNGHDPRATKLHDGAIPDKIRKKRIRGDSDNDGDTEDGTYKDKNYEDYDGDVRQPYLDGIYKFNIYDDPIPAVGEGWDT